jgi:hypothetical protein
MVRLTGPCLERCAEVQFPEPTLAEGRCVTRCVQDLLQAYRQLLRDPE